MRRERKIAANKIIKGEMLDYTQCMFKNSYNLSTANSPRNANKLCITFFSVFREYGRGEKPQNPSNEAQWWECSQVNGENDEHGVVHMAWKPEHPAASH